MILKESIANLLEQTAHVLSRPNSEQYTRPVKALSQSLIGQHIRNVLEFFIKLDKGNGSKLLDYDSRIRSLPLESDLVFATTTIQEVIAGLEKPDRRMATADVLIPAEFGEAAPRLKYRKAWAR